MSLFSLELYKVEFFYLVFPPFDMNFINNINIYLHRDCLGLFLLNTLDISNACRYSCNQRVSCEQLIFGWVIQLGYECGHSSAPHSGQFWPKGEPRQLLCKCIIYFKNGHNVYEPNAVCWSISPRDCHFF